MVVSILLVERPFTSRLVRPPLRSPSTSERGPGMEPRNLRTSRTTPPMSFSEQSSSGSVGSDLTVVVHYLRISVPPRRAWSRTSLLRLVALRGWSGIIVWSASGLLLASVPVLSLVWSPSPQLLASLALVSVYKESRDLTLSGKTVFPAQLPPYFSDSWPARFAILRPSSSSLSGTMIRSIFLRPTGLVVFSGT